MTFSRRTQTSADNSVFCLGRPGRAKAARAACSFYYGGGQMAGASRRPKASPADCRIASRL